MANLSDKFFEVLSDYPGSVQDRMKAYLVSTYSYDSSLNVYDMEFLVLRDLGYTGTLDDMWKAYLVSLGGSGVSSKAALLGSTFYAGAGYSVNGFNPAYVTDFGAEFYRKSGTTSTFSDSITHSASSNATMVDSDGLLKWRPHNLVPYSEAVTNWQAFGNATVSVSDGVFTLVEAITTAGHSISQACSSSSQVDLVVDIKANGRTKGRFDAGTASATYGANFDLVAETIDTAGSAITASSIVALSDGWYRLTIRSTDSNLFRIVIKDDTGATTYTGDGVSGFLFRYPHAYRSDLGGMVNNPDRGDSYVPTTSQAVYLPRRGHHVYNGDSWVNKGLLHESEARTNLLPYSEDFTDASWTKGALNPTLDAVGPDGVANSAATFTASGSPSYLYASATTAAGVATSSAFVKAGTASVVWLYWKTSANEGVAYFDFSDQTVQAVAGTNQTPANLTVEDVGGFYRVSATWAVGSETANFGIGIANAKGSISTTSGKTLIVYGFQIEAGSTPSSYIPTSGATVTRAAETLTVPAANLPWPSPVVIGEELVTNGTFDTDLTGWTNSNWTWSAGSAATTGVFGTLTQLVGERTKPKLIGIEYVKTSGRVQCQLIDSTAANPTTALGGAVDLSLLGASPLSVVMPAGYDTIRFTTTDTTATWTIDNVSVKEINPLSVSIQMQGEMNYIDNGSRYNTPVFVRWVKDSSNYILSQMRADVSGGTGSPYFRQNNAGVLDEVNGVNLYDTGVNVPFNIASRHGSTFINGAVDGTALTANTTPVALPDLSATDLELGYDYMGTISLFRVWADDLTDAGIAEAST